jgi:hypothetical protein
VLDGAADAAALDVLADSEGVVEQEEHTRDDVLDQRLGAKADRQADHAGAGEQRPDLDAERREHQHGHHHGERDHQELTEQGQQGLEARGALAAAFAADFGRDGGALLEGEPAVDRGLRDLPTDVGDQESQADVDQRGREPLGEPAPLEVEHVDAPEPGEDRHRADDQQDARRAMRHLAVSFGLVARQPVPGLDVGPDAMADRGIHQRHGDHQEQAPDAGIGGELIVQDIGDLRHRPEREHVEDGEARPDGRQEIAQSLGRRRALGQVFWRAAADQPGHRLASMPDERDQHADEHRGHDVAKQVGQIPIDPQQNEKIDGREAERADRRQPDDPPMQERRGLIVHG